MLSQTHACLPHTPPPGLKLGFWCQQTHPGRLADTPPRARHRHQLHAWDIPVTPRKTSTACSLLSLPLGSGLQSFPGGLSWPIWLGICCQHGQVRTGAPTADGDSFMLAPGLWLAVWAVQRPPRWVRGSLTVPASLLGLPAPSWPKHTIPGPGRVEPHVRGPGTRDSGPGQV